MNKKWDLRFLRMAKEISKWSKDTTKVGAVIAKGKYFKSLGYNGIAEGLDDSKVERTERPGKYFWYTHAECNSLDNYPKAIAKNCTMYITHFPCATCARRIIKNKISRIVTIKTHDLEFNERWKAEQDAALDMLTESGIIIDKYDENDLSNEIE